MMSVYKKLQTARCQMQRMKLNKSGENKFAKYFYFELGDFLPTINDLFLEHGLCGCISFTADLATLKVVDVEDGSSVEFTSPMGSADLKGCHVVQNIGAVETYQRRYLYVTALEIVEHDALEAVTGSPKPPADWAGLMADIVNSTNLDALKQSFERAVAEAKNDQQKKASFVKAKDKRKAELTTTEENA